MLNGPAIRGQGPPDQAHIMARQSSTTPQDSLVRRCRSSKSSPRRVRASALGDRALQVATRRAYLPNARKPGPHRWLMAMADEEFIGRERECAQLALPVAEALAGHGSLVLLAGEAAVGKTTLVRRVLAGSALTVLEGFATAGALRRSDRWWKRFVPTFARRTGHSSKARLRLTWHCCYPSSVRPLPKATRPRCSR